MKKGYNNEPRSSSSCAACKLLKRRCSLSCIFAPYFRANELRKFANVHKVFGASNVSKILNEVPEEHREETVNSLLFEAEARLQDPVYGCLGAIALLQTQMFQLEHDLSVARARLAQYKAASSLCADNYSNNNIFNYNVSENDLFGLGDHNNNVNNNHMNLCKEEYLICSDQFSQSDGGGYCDTNDFGLVPDLFPL